MARLPRGKIGAACAAMMAFGACSSHSTSRVVFLHALAACIPFDASDGGDAQPMVTFAPAGDFAPGPSPTIPASGAGFPLPFNPATQDLAAQIGMPSPSFLALGGIPPSGDVNLLLWSAVAPCAATTPAVAVGGETMGLVDATHVLLVPGQDDPFLFDLTTGTNTRLSGQALNLVGATITPFDGGALIAGGVGITSTSMFVAQAIYTFTLGADGRGTFQSEHSLQTTRAKAGSLVLPNGDTLLVGGITGLPSTVTASMEILDVSTGTSTLAAASLQTARFAPTVMRLTNGQIAVAGGLDVNQKPVTTIEWFDGQLTAPPLGELNLLPLSQPDAGVSETATQYLCAPLEGGALLAVIAGLPTNNVFVVQACDATQIPCSPPVAAAIALDPSKFPFTNDVPALFPAARGAPVLWTGTTWLRWQPWSGQFTTTLDQNDASITTTQGPQPIANGTGFGTLAVDPGLATWIGSAGSLFGLRYDTRNPFVIDTYFDSTNTAPDRLVESAGISTFNWNEGDVGGLTISGDVKAFVTDATYANMTLTATMLANYADIILRTEDGCEYTIGGSSSCSSTPIPPVACSGMMPDFGMMGLASVSVVRSGSSVTWSLVGTGTTLTCTPGFLATDRVSVGFHGRTQGAVISGLSIVRNP